MNNSQTTEEKYGMEKVKPTHVEPVFDRSETVRKVLNTTVRYDMRHYKTVMCKRLLGGGCEFGEDCVYAHSKDQLRESKANYEMMKAKREQYTAWKRE